jgi:hypothetical protein
MDIPSRRRSWAIAVYMLLVACLVFVVSSPARTTAAGTSCAELREWANSYANASPTLDDLAPFDRAQRVAIFNAVGPAVRAELWREHLRRFATRAELTATQRAFILQARADLSAASYTDRDPALRRAQSRKFWASAEPLFPRMDHRRAWFVLGEMTTPSTSHRLTAAAGPPPALATSLLLHPTCNCNDFFGWFDCYSGVCGGGTCNVEWACGPEGQHECHGRCVP